jgi:hypothetical protein
MMQMAKERVAHLYDLGDAAYCAEQIREYSRSLGHVPIIDHNPRKGEKIQMEPAKKARYRERTTAERAFSNLKDNHGGNFVRVRGAKKVMAHLMFGIIALTASQLCRMFREKEEWEKEHKLPDARAALSNIALLNYRTFHGSRAVPCLKMRKVARQMNFLPKSALGKQLYVAK